MGASGRPDVQRSRRSCADHSGRLPYRARGAGPESSGLDEQWLCQCRGQNKLAEDFQFFGLVVGPLIKEPLSKAIKESNLGCEFLDMKSNYCRWHVDPFEPNRDWFFSRSAGTHTGT